MTRKSVIFLMAAVVLLAAGCEKGGKNSGKVKQEDPFVAMGDGLLWAKCNVGADKPWDYGDYFAWGEAVTYYAAGHALDNPCNDWERYVPCWADVELLVSRTGYNYASYKWKEKEIYGTISDYLTKYTVADNHTSGRWYETVEGQNNKVFKGDNGDGVEHWSFESYDYEDDPARQNLGAPWRTPTVGEWDNLLNEDKFEWKWEDDYNGSGVAGMVVTSKIEGYEGKNIFLPAAGYRNEKGLIDAGDIGDYWTSFLDTSSYANYVSLYMGANFGKAEIIHYGIRCQGLSIRPVREELN